VKRPAGPRPTWRLILYRGMMNNSALIAIIQLRTACLLCIETAIIIFMPPTTATSKSKELSKKQRGSLN